MSDTIIEVQRRERFGKSANRKLRAAGHVPAVIYGGDGPTTPLKVSIRRVEELLRDTADSSPVFLLKMAGTDKSRHAMIRELTTDPITGALVHIDFIRINMDEEVRAMVPVELHGTPAGVKNEGGMLDFITREVEIESLPNAIPGRLDLDVSALTIGEHVEAEALELPEGVQLVTEPDTVIVTIQVRRLEEEEEEEPEEEMVEPEVVSRGKEDDEAEAEAED